MKTSELIRKLQRELNNYGDKEVRKGIYGGETEIFESVYYDEDKDITVIY